ncbi:MAG: hypothetical protein ACD_2C00151G0002 [uncultured bacterium (gcode 4)]|uniref:Uncharacterized protein n=1 Tax=uncultured bacterium (gcode 4) TaxID=1234023 RepID=K2G5K1_9BACT|nr:MAG: hypothetical protein ACD_2C00151G0002 [uncultured bacterium (gcode 4)]
MRYTKNNKAFTLVELIVVIVILAILATIAFLSFSSQSGSARDSTRLSDISSIKKSVEIYNVNAWTYPSPDYAYSYTYSWGIIWNQWTIWDSAYKMLQKNLSKKVVDPLKWSEYDYSLASNKREYQVAWNFENPTSFERNYNPFDSSVLSPKLSALGWTGANVYISWNYNWVMLKVFTGSTYYFVPTPTLFWIWTWSTVYDNTFWSWKDLLPWVNNAAVFDSSKVYASTSSTWLSTTEVTALMVTIQSAYLTWNVTTPAVQAVLAATWNALTDLWVWLVKNSLGGWTTSVSQWWGTATTQVDSGTLMLMHFDWSLADLGSNESIIVNNWTTFATWKFSNAAYFDWTDYISLSDSPTNNWEFDANTSYTIDFWVYNIPFSAINILFHKDNYKDWFPNGGETYAYIDASSKIHWGSINWEWNTWLAISPNTWTHVALMYDWVIKKAYALVNWVWTYVLSPDILNNHWWGAPFTSNATGPLYIWVSADKAAHIFKWSIDEFRISRWVVRWDCSSIAAGQQCFTPPATPY